MTRLSPDANIRKRLQQGRNFKGAAILLLFSGMLFAEMKVPSEKELWTRLTAWGVVGIIALLFHLYRCSQRMGHLENISVQVEQDQISGSTFTYKDKNRSSEPYRFEIRFQDIEKVTYKNRKLHFSANNQLVTLYDLPGLDELYRTIRKKIEENSEGGHA